MTRMKRKREKGQENAKSKEMKLICVTLPSPPQVTVSPRSCAFSRVSMGLTVRRKTAKNLAVRRKNERILAVSRKKNLKN